MQTRNRHNNGFTLIELIAAMAIFGLMLFMINELFNNTSAAVSRSVQNSKVIATTRIMTEQVNDDCENMLGPALTGPGGFLMIVQERYSNVPMTDPQSLTEVTVPSIRSDSLVFIRNAKSLRSMTPQNASSYGSSLGFAANDTDAYAKVWLGHALRTAANGQPRTGTGVGIGGANAGLDKLANNLVFGRHALLFNPTDQDANTPLSANPGSYIYADSAYYNSPVQNVTGFGGTDVAYMGLTDVTVQEYYNSSNAADPNSLYGQVSPVVAAVQTFYNLNYGDIGGFRQRMHVNPSPDPAATGLESWAFAQSHAVLAQSCSEIVINFAADLNGNGLIDTQFGGGADTSGPIWWYDGIEQPFLGDSSNNGTWVQQNNTSVPPNGFQPQPFINVNNNIKVLIFRPTDAHPYDYITTDTAPQAHSYWPYLLRIRYRLHDTRGRLTSNNPAALRDGFDNDGDGAADNSDPGADEDRYAGRWVEHIVKVPRPD